MASQDRTKQLTTLKTSVATFVILRKWFNGYDPISRRAPSRHRQTKRQPSFNNHRYVLPSSTPATGCGAMIPITTPEKETDEEFRSPETDFLVQSGSIKVIFVQPRKNLSKILSKTMMGSSCVYELKSLVMNLLSNKSSKVGFIKSELIIFQDTNQDNC